MQSILQSLAYYGRKGNQHDEESTSCESSFPTASTHFPQRHNRHRHGWDVKWPVFPCIAAPEHQAAEWGFCHPGLEVIGAFDFPNSVSVLRLSF